MRWLLLKDLQVLRRSPLLTGLLVAYPVVLAVLIGLALSAGPSKPRVAFANLVPPGERSLEVGGERVDAARYARELARWVELVPVASRAEAVRRVRDGDVLAALVIPPDLAQRLEGTLGLGGGSPPAVEVVYGGRDPVKRRYVEATVRSRLAEANGALSAQLTQVAASYLGVVVRGGTLSLLGRDIDVLGLERAATILRATLAALPASSPERVALEQVARFAQLAADNLDVSGPILRSIGQPVRVRETVLGGARQAPLDRFAVAVAVAVSLEFITLLLAAGLLALEREEGTFARLTRGLLGPGALLAEKVVLAAGCAFLLGLAMLCGLAAFVGLDWGRAPAWLAALALAALAFAALGTALGALAREVRAASLLAFALALPLAFLALVPGASVAGWVADVLGVVSGAFPFRPALSALDAAINGGGLLAPLAHLAALALLFTGVARLALRRF